MTDPDPLFDDTINDLDLAEREAKLAAANDENMKEDDNEDDESENNNSDPGEDAEGLKEKTQIAQDAYAKGFQEADIKNKELIEEMKIIKAQLAAAKENDKKRKRHSMIEAKKNKTPSKPATTTTARVATNSSINVHDIVKDLFKAFALGATIKSAAELFEKNRDDDACVAALAICAFVPKKVIEEKKLDTLLIERGYVINENQYNHTMARLTGNMLMEANEYPEMDSVREKIGGRSMLTPNPTKLSDAVKEIFEKNQKKFTRDEIAKYKSDFRVKDLIGLLS